VESVHARENVELAVEHRCVANIAALRRVDRNVLVTLIALLVAKLLRIVGVLANLFAKDLNLLFVVFEAATQVFFHVLNFCFFGELLQQVLHLEFGLGAFSDKFERVRDGHFTLTAFKQKFCDLHPEVTRDLFVGRFVSVLLGCLPVVALEGQFDCLLVDIQNTEKRDLGFLHVNDSLFQASSVRITLLKELQLLLVVVFHLLADIEGVSYIEMNGLIRIVIDFLLFEVGQ
jgi:hypothetical protein